MGVLESARPFVGRAAEAAELRRELAAARAGRPRVVLVEGEAGIGKSALLHHVFATEPDVTVLRATGEEWESFLGYGVVDQLMRVAGVSSSSLLVSRRRALPVEEPVGVGARILEALEELEQKAPVVIQIDDVHWADLDSLRALLFVARRLVGERVLIVLAERSDAAPRLPAGLRRLAGGDTGVTVRLGALSATDVQALAPGFGVPRLSTTAARRLQEHTAGNPLYVTTLLTETPPERWLGWDPLPAAPRAFALGVVERLEACSQGARRLVEAVAVLGAGAPSTVAAELAAVADPADPADADLLRTGGYLDAVEEAVELHLLAPPDERVGHGLAFTHPLVRAAVYEQLGPARRVRLHAAAVGLVGDEGAALRHRVLAASPPDPGLVADLDAFARRRASAGAWAAAAWALLEASRLSLDPHRREQWLLRAVDAMISAGDLVQAESFAREAAAFASGPLRNAALGYLAVLRGEPAEAQRLLRPAWERSDDPALRAVIAQRLALHEVGRLDGVAVVDWAERAIELAGPQEPIRMEAAALVGLGIGWQGRPAEGLAAYDAVLAAAAEATADVQLDRVRFAQGWLRLAVDDLPGARAVLTRTAPAALHGGSIRIALWAYAWLARVNYALGAWDEAAADAERAVSLLEESGHEWLRPLVRSAAVLVPAARGSWTAAEEHAAAATAGPGGYELMVVAAGLAQAQVPAARGDHDGVLAALAPVLRLSGRDGVDEPGFWPWPEVYADALVSAGRLDEAEAFLEPHERLASARGVRSAIAGLARARGRLAAVRGQPAAAEEAFRRGLAELEALPMPMHRAELELAYGQALRRAGRRRAAAEQLTAARDRFAGLRAAPYLERCERELAASGLRPAKRSTFDRSRLTAQELAVARLVALGMSNRQVASELFVSVKTVQFHLGHIYAKLGLSSRAELAARFREHELTDGGAGAPDDEEL